MIHTALSQLSFIVPPTLVLRGLDCWKVGRLGSQKTPVVVPALHTP